MLEQNEYVKASRLRAKLKAGKRLTPEQEGWLADYQRRLTRPQAANERLALPPYVPTAAPAAPQATQTAVPPVGPPPIPEFAGNAPAAEKAKPEPTAEKPAEPAAEKPAEPSQESGPKIDFGEILDGALDSYCDWVKASQKEIAESGWPALSDDGVDHLVRPAAKMVMRDIADNLAKREINPQKAARVIVAAPIGEYLVWKWLQNKKKKKADAEKREAETETRREAASAPQERPQETAENKPVPAREEKPKRKSSLFAVAEKR